MNYHSSRPLVAIQFSGGMWALVQVHKGEFIDSPYFPTDEIYATGTSYETLVLTCNKKGYAVVNKECLPEKYQDFLN